jgi:hypothetical protein
MEESVEHTKPFVRMSCPAKILLALLTLFFSPLVSESYAFPMQDDQTAGSMANDAKKRNNYWHHFDLGLFDGKIKTSPPDSHRYDRRMEVLANFGFDRMITGRLGARINIKGEFVRKRLSDDSDPPTIFDQTIQTYRPSLDVTFITDKGLELFGGVVGEIQPENSMVSKTQNGTSTTTNHDGKLVARRFGVVRRAGAWGGGFYYQLASESKRAVTQTAFDGTSISSNEVIFLPARMGIFGAFSAYSLLWDFELGFIQARGIGQKDETGNTAFTDHFDAKLCSLYMFTSNVGLKSAVSHRTQSYANSAYINLDTIPATTVRSSVIFGTPDSHNYIGIIYGFGRDGQSLPEFNSTYEYKAMALTTGLVIPL